MIGMARYPDKYFDLAIVDPPYGLGNRLSDGGGKLKDTPMATLYRESTQWDVKPDENYFIELFRVSKNQIIWGGNYFELPPSRCMICWNKLQAMPTLSAWELGWTSFDKPSKIFSHVSTDNNRSSKLSASPDQRIPMTAFKNRSVESNPHGSVSITGETAITCISE